MKDSTITYVHHKLKLTQMVSDNSFEFRKDLKYHWLQKACFWILRKIGCFRQFTDESIVVSRFQPKSFMDSIMKQRFSIEDIYDIRPERLVIGAKDFEDLMGLPEFRQYFSFSAGADFNNLQMFGMTIEVVPWMKGCVLLPAKRQPL